MFICICVPSYLDDVVLWVCPASMCIVRDVQYDSVGFLGSGKELIWILGVGEAG